MVVGNYVMNLQGIFHSFMLYISKIVDYLALEIVGQRLQRESIYFLLIVMML